MSFPADTSIAERVAALSPILTTMIEQFEAGEWKDGVEAFQDDMVGRLFAAGLLKKDVWLDIMEVGVHPDNREGNMLVPVDVHDLLLRLSQDGWSWNKWTAMVTDVPAGLIGECWAAECVKLAENSGGLLPPYQADQVKYVTGRGSHGTAAVRLVKFGGKGIHDELCGDDGKISKSKILETQPSMEAPLQKGCPYDVVHSAVVIAVPRLMEVLSRVGNAGQTTFRAATALQHCSRIHNLAVARQKRGRLHICIYTYEYNLEKLRYM